MAEPLGSVEEDSSQSLHSWHQMARTQLLSSGLQGLPQRSAPALQRSEQVDGDLDGETPRRGGDWVVSRFPSGLIGLHRKRGAVSMPRNRLTSSSLQDLQIPEVSKHQKHRKYKGMVDTSCSPVRSLSEDR